MPQIQVLAGPGADDVAATAGAVEHARDADFDDCTRATSAFFRAAP